MAATRDALLRYRQEDANAQAGGLTDGLDAFQIVGAGGQILMNLDTNGYVNNPAVGTTNGTNLGQFLTRLKNGATTAELFADVFSNPSQLDVFQLVDEGGNISYWLNYQGVVDA